MNYSAPGPPPSDGLGGFFDSIRRIGISRAPNRWIGGVASGIGVRLGIDALIVRGILLVMTLFGGLGLLIYGVAWALLPEATDGRIHLQEAIRGRFDAALAGAILFALVGASRIGFWWGGWADLPITFGLLALSGLIIVVVLAVRAGSKHNGTPPPPGAGGTPAPRPGGPTPQGPGGPTPQGPGGPPAPGNGGTPGQDPATPGQDPSTPGQDPSMQPGSSMQPGAGTTPPFGGPPPEGQQPAGPTPAPYGPQDPETTPIPPPGTPPTEATAAVPAPLPPAPPSEQDDAMTDHSAGPADKPAGHDDEAAGAAGVWSTGQDAHATATMYRPGPSAAAPTPPPRPPRPRRRGPGPGLVRATWGLALVAVAALVLGGEYYDWPVSPWLLGLGGALAIFGLGVCVAGFLGRRTGSLSFMGVVLAIVLLPWAFVVQAVNTDGSLWNPVDYGEMRWEPDSPAEAAEGFDGLAAGSLTVDLEGLQGVNVTTPIDIRVGVGEATLLVPDGMPVEITTDVQGGVTTRGLDGWTAESRGREFELNSYSDLGWQIGTGMAAELHSPEAEKASDPIQVNVDVDLGAIDIREVS